MDYINATIFGLAQGLTEFLPISSSGHLIVLHNFINLPIKDDLTFDVVLHLATLLAVVWFFSRDIAKLLIGLLKSFTGKIDDSGRLSWLIVLATIPAALAGWLAEDFIKSNLRSVAVVAVMLIVIGVFFLVSEKFSRQTLEIKNLAWKAVLFIGLTQAIALVPGTSRAGITIIAGLAMGLKRQEAVKFSFLLSIPIIAGAAAAKIPQIFSAGLTNAEYIVLLISFLFSLIFGLLAIKYLLRFAKNHTLSPFAYYRFALAVLIVLLFVF